MNEVIKHHIMVLVSVSATPQGENPFFILFEFEREELKRFKEEKKTITFEGGCCGQDKCLACLFGGITVSLANYTEIPADAKTAKLLLDQQEKSYLNHIAVKVTEELEPFLSDIYDREYEGLEEY